MSSFGLLLAYLPQQAWLRIMEYPPLTQSDCNVPDMVGGRIMEEEWVYIMSEHNVAEYYLLACRVMATKAENV